MKVFNVSGNLMSLGALDFGIIIDGAVIVMDNCVRLLSSKAKELGRNLSRKEIKEQVLKATTEIRSAAGFGQIIIIVVFLPIFALTGVEAKMFIPMAATFCFALGAAFLFSFTFFVLSIQFPSFTAQLNGLCLIITLVPLGSTNNLHLKMKKVPGLD